MTINGTNLDDVLYGTSSNDVIYGLDGADYVLADAGNDSVYGGAGNDIVYAALGNDSLWGGLGNDQLFAGYGDDVAYGGEGHDIIDGEYGNDILLGDAGNDRIIGGFGSDFLSGGTGDDAVESHTSFVSDFVVEKDELYGGAGRDVFRLRTDYLGGAASLNPLYDASFALIRDFNRAEDTLDMRYDSNYTIGYGNFYGSTALDTVLSWNGNVVAVVQDNQLAKANLV